MEDEAMKVPGTEGTEGAAPMPATDGEVVEETTDETAA